MSRRRPSHADVALAAAAAAACLGTFLTWTGLTADDAGFLGPLLLASVGVMALGLVARSTGVPAPVTLLVQAGAVGLVLHRAWSPSDRFGGWLPTGPSVRELGGVLALAADTAGQYAAPVPADAPEFLPLLVACGVVVVLAVDFLACTLRLVPLAGLPLLAAFTAPVSITGEVPLLGFVAAAAGFLAMLTAGQARALSRWGRSVSAASSALWRDADVTPHEVRPSALARDAARIGAVGVVLAALAPALVPDGDGLLGGGVAGVDGTGDGGQVRLDNPIVDVRRDLRRGDDVPLLWMWTTEATPAYVRIAALDEFDGTSWRPGERGVPPGNQVDGTMPLPIGLSATVPRREQYYDLQVTERFSSTWLPLPFPVAEVQVSGDWRYDGTTLDVLSAEQGQTTRGLGYQAVGLDLRPSTRALVGAPPAPNAIQEEGTRLPGSMPGWLEDLAVQVTTGASSQFERAVLLQEWFRSEGGFTYSLQTDDGNGLDTLTTFLGTGPGSRVGYCEQFASAMAIMARSLGIPSRVAVGFLTPEPVEGLPSRTAPDGRETSAWEFSAWDLHAWPELYFAGAGWVRFEPTPPDRASSVPTYTAGEVPSPQDLDGPREEPTTQNPDRQALEGEENAQGSEVATEGGGPSRGWLVGLGLLVALALLGPALTREAQRRRRLSARRTAGAAAEATWAELRATSIDLGLDWPHDGTLRDQARMLAGHLPAATSAQTDLEALVATLERARYSRRGLEEDPRLVRARGRSVIAAAWASASPRERRRARWWPVSLWSRRRSSDAAAVRTDEQAADEREQVSV